MRAEARLWRRCESTLLLMDEDQLHLQSMASSKSKKCSGLLRRTLFMTPRDSSAEPSTTSITISPQIRFFMEGSFATWTATPPPILCPITMIGVFLFVFTSGRRWFRIRRQSVVSASTDRSSSFETTEWPTWLRRKRQSHHAHASQELQYGRTHVNFSTGWFYVRTNTASRVKLSPVAPAPWIQNTRGPSFPAEYIRYVYSIIHRFSVLRPCHCNGSLQMRQIHPSRNQHLLSVFVVYIVSWNYRFHGNA